MFMKKKTNRSIVTIPTALERELLFASLYSKYGMWEASFIVTKTGRIRANPTWWRKHNLWNELVWVEIHCYCKGWKDGRRSGAKK
jgi:hypothetical protein